MPEIGEPERSNEPGANHATEDQGIASEAKAKAAAPKPPKAKPRTKIKKGPNKLKKKGFMLKLDGIFAAGGIPGKPGPPQFKKKTTPNPTTDGSTESKEEKKPTSNVDGGASVTSSPAAPAAAPAAAPGAAETKAGAAESKPASDAKEGKQKQGSQDLGITKKKPKVAGKRKKRKKMKFDKNKTAFSAQPVREYKKTDYTANALKLTEKQRIQVMTMVKEGKMSVDDAMKAVLEHDKNVREALSDQQNHEEGKKREFKAHFKASDLAKLTDEQRMKVMHLVKDNKVTVEEAMAEVIPVNDNPARKHSIGDDDAGGGEGTAHPTSSKPASNCCTII
mmetsp:Transcript_14360/g.28974  ORF Transcript_14360/g.28974 Transcript_14360/m.28974 type:complete len:335 (+) Transcript_14360:174-1178(+)